MRNYWWLREPTRRPDDRTLAAACALVAGTSHIPLIPEHLREAPYIGWSFIGLVIASVIAAAALLISDSRVVWLGVASVYAAAIGAFALSRTVGLPQMGDDIGNWTEPWSYPALTAELMAVALALGIGLRRAVVRVPA